MLEKRFLAVGPQALIADGTADGKITVADTRLFKVKQKVFLQSSTQQSRDGLEIKKIINDTEMLVGPEKSAIHITSDVSDFLIADTATVASNEQFRPIIPSEEFNRAVYEEEPTVAIRSMLVDKLGNDYRQDNPLPISGTLSVEIGNEVEIKNDIDNPIPVSGTVDVGNFPTSIEISALPEVEIKNDIDNPIPISKNTLANSDTNPLYVKGTSDTSFFHPMQTDAFGRLRTSNPITLFDSFHRYQDNGKWTEYTSGTASSSHSEAHGAITLTVGSSMGDKIYRETSRVFSYQPGKSLMILETFCMSPAKSGLRQRQGFFDTQSGIYIELEGSALRFVRRSSVTGALVEKRVEQADWNVDTLINGSTLNPSGVHLNINSRQIFFIDVEWLGVGSVRMGFVIDGQFINCHTFNHANELPNIESDVTLPYMATACLPVRVELENLTNTTDPSSYRSICTSVMSEGGYELRGRPRTVLMPVNAPKVLGTAATFFPLISIRLKSNRLGSIVIPKNFTILPTSVGSSRLSYKIMVNTTLTGASWQSAGSDSGIEYDYSATAVSGGTALTSGLLSSSNQNSPSASALDGETFKFQLERNSFTGTAYVLSIVVAAATKDDTVLGSLDWEEIV